MAFEIGSTVGDYEIVQVLGAGGMGKVYKVRNLISDRIEAMKVLLPDLAGDAELADRFMREIKVQASLDHPNIAALHTALRIDNQLLMVMEYVEGRALDSILKAGRIPPRDGVDYIAQVLDALSFAHARGVIHRDIKPANMMLTGAGVVKLMDFGIAKLSADRTITQTGRTVGSLYYMSPEQIQGATLDARADLYSVGVSLYEMVTGARPFQGDSDFSIMAAHMQQTPAAPVALDARLPPALNEAIMMSIAKEPERRFQSAGAFRNALLSVAKDLPAAAAVDDSKTVVLPRAAAVLASTRVSTSTIPPLPAATPPALPPAAPRPSRRGLYMILGSLATLAALALGITQIPKFVGASAKEGSPAPSGPSMTPTPGPAIAQPPETGPRNQAQRPAPSPAAAQTPAPTQPVNPAQRALATPTPAPPSAAAPTPAVVVTPAPVPARPAGPDPAAAQQLSELRRRMGLMSVRADTIQSSLHRLSQEQAASGLGPSPELTSAARRMQLHMEQAAAELRNGNGEAARSSLDNAERELDKLEEKFNR